VPAGHWLVSYREFSIEDFRHEPVIVPERRTRPHSHDLTMNVFRAGGCFPVIAQYAEEKQTILSFVAAGLGIALVPSSYKNMNADGVHYLALSSITNVEGLPLSVMWHQGNKNIYVTALLDLLSVNSETLIRDM